MKHEIIGKTRYCPCCPYYTYKSSTLSMHLANKHNKASRIHKCRQCDATFTAQTKLAHHVTNHHQEPTISCLDPNCDFKFKNSTTHKVHYVRAHMYKMDLFRDIPNTKDCRCNSCNQIFNSKSAVEYHVANCSIYSPFCPDSRKTLVQLANFLEDDISPLDLPPSGTIGYVPYDSARIGSNMMPSLETPPSGTIVAAELPCDNNQPFDLYFNSDDDFDLDFINDLL